MPVDIDIDEVDESEESNQSVLPNTSAQAFIVMAQATATQGNTSNPLQSHVFHVDKSLITAASSADDELGQLGLAVYNQDDFEQGVMQQVDRALAEQEHERLARILRKELKDIEETLKLNSEDLKQCEDRFKLLSNVAGTNVTVKRQLTEVSKKKEHVLKQIERLNKQKHSILGKLLFEATDQEPSLASLDQTFGLTAAHVETEQERMVRVGEMTPFGTMMTSNAKISKNSGHQPSTSATLTDFEKFLLDQAKKSEEPKRRKAKRTTKPAYPRYSASSTTNQLTTSHGAGTNFFDKHDRRQYRPAEKDFSNVKPKKNLKFAKLEHNFTEDGDLNIAKLSGSSDDGQSDEDYKPAKQSESEDEQEFVVAPKRKKRLTKHTFTTVNTLEPTHEGVPDATASASVVPSPSKTRIVAKDDGNRKSYLARLKAWRRQKLEEKLARDMLSSDDDDDVEIDNGFKVPAKVWNKLYRYQQTCVKWLWELHTQQCGGIIGDEMGLGKTIQVIAFLVGLYASKVHDDGSGVRYNGRGPCIIVCPATVMHQWVKEFHTWWPQFRVAVLHSTGSAGLKHKSHLVREIFETNGILITSYAGVVQQQDLLLRFNWQYIILDEGHKIRNPDAQATLACKQFRTCHRLILSGSPIQNNLKELWSLFDFIFPGKLGTLPDFMTHFSVPIVQGGYATATQVQVATAYKCACLLRDTINPYLLRRMKADVKSSLSLPQKNEQVLFCRLTSHQRQVYQEYLDSKECDQILKGKFMVFPGLITLRKICNHPDLSTGGPKIFDPDLCVKDEPTLQYGHWSRSGKLLVVQALLKLWRKQNHRVLLFTQGQQMLHILEAFMKAEGYSYLRMDGCTPIGSRQPLIKNFNEDPSHFIFLLTTRVGGLGVNLTGADRVLIYDPDWNPSTDTQARERAWRIGQTRNVTIYRLLTAGTIEEKIYHRQIFKQFLTNRVLKDPRQRRFFKSNDLFELFSLADEECGSTETSALFAGTGADVCVKRKHKKNRFDLLKEKQKTDQEALDIDTAGTNEGDINEDTITQLHQLAQSLSDVAGEQPDLDHGDNNTDKDSRKRKKSKSGEKTRRDKNTKPHKKHHKRKKDAKFEGKRISNLVRHSTFETPTDNSQKDDDYVLRKLLKKSGVHSALQHDTIMSASDPDYALVEQEAQKVAREAAAALKRSRSLCQGARSGVPTWTGSHGTLARPRFGHKNFSSTQSSIVKPIVFSQLFDGSQAGTSSQQGALLSSSDLLARIRSRRLQPPSPSDDEEDSAGIPDTDPATLNLATELRNFVAFGASIPGTASTQEILDHFTQQVPKNESAKFKFILKQLCTMDRKESIGMWRLRPEFR